MKLTAKAIPERFVKSIPRGFRLVREEGREFLLVESVFCPKGHNLVVDAVRIHGEASIKLKIAVGEEPGLVFVDAFWGSHAKLFSFIPTVGSSGEALVDAVCPYCDASLMEPVKCGQRGCHSDRSIRLHLPGGKNVIHVCARLGCPAHDLEVVDLPQTVVRRVSVINYFGAQSDEAFGDI